MDDEYQRGASDDKVGCHSLLFIVVRWATHPAGCFKSRLVHYTMSIGGTGCSCVALRLWSQHSRSV